MTFVCLGFHSSSRRRSAPGCRRRPNRKPRVEHRAARTAWRTATILISLQAAGRLGDGIELTTYQPIDRSEAEKRDPQFYEAGQSAHFLKRYGRFEKGETCEIVGADDHGIILDNNGRRSTLSYCYADRFVVARAQRIEVAPGDRLQLKANGRSVEGERVHNGELVTVECIEPTGALVVIDERQKTKTLAPSQRLFVRGYAASDASQGKTADTVLFADAGSAAATNAQQWYVTISRGRKRVMVFTSDKVQLRASEGYRRQTEDGAAKQDDEFLRYHPPIREGTKKLCCQPPGPVGATGVGVGGAGLIEYS